MQITEALDQTEKRIVELRALIERAQDELDELDREREALLAAGRRWGQIPKPLVMREGNPWMMYGRSDAVERALREAGGDTDIAGLMKILSSHGRTGDSYPLVSAALSHLKNKGVAEKAARRGFWHHMSLNATGPARNGAGGGTSPVERSLRGGGGNGDDLHADHHAAP